jgi:hypothetical protein
MADLYLCARQHGRRESIAHASSLRLTTEHGEFTVLRYRRSLIITPHLGQTLQACASTEYTPNKLSSQPVVNHAAVEFLFFFKSICLIGVVELFEQRQWAQWTIFCWLQATTIGHAS